MMVPKQNDWSEVLLIVVGIIVLACCIAGCKVPDGLQYQVSGLQIAPLGDSPQTPKITFGVLSYSMAPADGRPVLNRVQIKGLGLNHTATVATGPIGQEIEAAGPDLIGALGVLHSEQDLPQPRPERIQDD